MTADRMRVPGFGRNGTERENWSLRDNILQLEEELTLTRSQLSKVTYQLQAVVALVKRFVSPHEQYVSNYEVQNLS